MSRPWTTAPVAASAETMSYPGAARSGRSQTSPEGPRDENAESEDGWFAFSPAQVLSPGTLDPARLQPAHVLPDAVSSWFTSQSFADAETLRACGAAPGASSRLPMYGPLFPADATKSVPFPTASAPRAALTASMSLAVFRRCGRDSEPRLMFTMFAPTALVTPPGHERTTVSFGRAAHSIAAIRSELMPTPPSVKTLPMTSVASGATPTYLPRGSSVGDPSPVPVAIPETWVPWPLRSCMSAGVQVPPVKFCVAVTFGSLSGCDQRWKSRSSRSGWLGSIPVSSTAIFTPVPVSPWLQSALAPTSAGVPRVWSATTESSRAWTSSMGASDVTHGSAATVDTAAGEDARANTLIEP